MNDGADAVVEDRVVVVLAVLREAVGAAFFAAMEILRAEVPAARPLHQIAANGPHVANLRRADARNTLRERHGLFLDQGMPFDLRERDARTGAQARGVFHYSLAA